jgi:acyl carrier protein
MDNENSASVRDQIREFILDLAKAKGVASITDQQSLVENQVIDSLSIFRLVAFLEDTFRIRIPDEEISDENLKSVEVIEALVRSKAA